VNYSLAGGTIPRGAQVRVDLRLESRRNNVEELVAAFARHYELSSCNFP
jgi:hypothetical protein